MLKDSLIILKKELRRIFTDRKLLFFLVVLPLVMLPLMYSFMGRASRSKQNEIQEYRSTIAICFPVGSAGGSAIILDALASLNSDILLIDQSELDSIGGCVAGKSVELLLVIPGNSDEMLRRSIPFDLSVYFNSTGDYSEYTLNRVTTLFAMLNDSLVEERITAEGLSADILTAFTVNAGPAPESYDLAEEGSLMGKIIGLMVPFFVVIYLFANSMKVGLDSVAGEKERGTLAVLLVNQVGRLSIVMGKMMSVMIAAVVGAVSSAIGLKIASRYLLDMYSGHGEPVSEYTMASMDFVRFGIIVIPLAILISCVVLIVSTYAKNVKEGQGMIMPVYIAVMVMGITTMQSGDVPPGWMRAAPLFNSLVAMKDIFMQTSSWGDIIFSTVTSLLLSAVLIFVTLRMFNDERILFRV